MDISRPLVEKPRFIGVEKFVEARTNSIAQLLKAIDNDALVSGEVTKGPRTAAQRLPRHMRRRAMAYDVRRFPKSMRDFASSHLISKHAKKCPSRFARRKNANARDKFGRSSSLNGKWLSTHVWHAKRYRMISKWGFKIADRSFQRGFRAVLRDSNKQCVIRDRSYYTCVTIEAENAYNTLSAFSVKTCRPQTSRDEEEECHQLYLPGRYPRGYIGPARCQRLTGTLSNQLHLWIHPSSREHFLNAFIEHHGLLKQENSEAEHYKNEKVSVTVDAENISRFHLSGPKSMSKLRDSVRFFGEHQHFLSVANSLFSSNRDGEVMNLLIEDPRTAWDRKTDLGNRKKTIGTTNEAPIWKFWSKESRNEAERLRMSNSEFQKQNSSKIGGFTETDAKVPLLIIVRNSGHKALDGIDLLVPEPFSKDLWVALQRRAVRASGLRDEVAAHLESQSLCFPIDDVESEAGKTAEQALKDELTAKYLGKPHNRRCHFWSTLSVKYPFEFRWNELVKTDAFVCRDLVELRKIWVQLKSGSLEEKPDGMLVPVKLSFFGRGRPKRFGMICVPTEEDLVSIRQNKNREIIQTSRTAVETETVDPEDEPMDESRKELQGFVSLDAAASEKPINLKWLFETTGRLDDRSTKRKRANKKKRESKKRRKLEMLSRKEKKEEEETEKGQVDYSFSANREIIGRLVAGEQSVLAGHGIAIGYVSVAALGRIASNYRKTKTVVMVRNTTSKYYHPAYLTILTDAVQI